MITNNPEHLADTAPPTSRVPIDVGVRRVLVVSWDPDLRHRLESLAAGQGHDVTCCPSSKEAVKLCEGNAFDMLLVDSNLYGMRTLDFVVWLAKQRGIKLPWIIAVGAVESPAELKTLLDAGVRDVVDPNGSNAHLTMRMMLAERSMAKEGSRSEDDSRQRVNQRRFENLFLESPDAILVLKNQEGKIVGANRSVKNVLGVDGKSLLGKYLSLVLPQLFDPADGGLAAIENPLKAQTKLEGIPHRKSTGETVYLDILVSAIPWDKGFALMLICREVTERESTEELRVSAGKEETVKMLARGMARDFGNVITSVSGNLALLGQQPFASAETQQLVSSAESACERARRLSMDLLSFAGNAPNPLRQPVDVRTMVEKTVQFTLVDHGKTKPVFHFEDDLWAVAAEERQVVSVIDQITRNADAAMGDRIGGGTLFIDCGNVLVNSASRIPLPEGRYVRFSFRDEGPGLSDANMRRVFDPYFTLTPGGAGLGLARAAAIVRSHGGHIRVNGAEGEGALFEFFVPASEVQVGSGADGEKEMGARVLFLDDEPDVRLVVDKALSAHGFEVYCAKTGEEAMEVYHRAVEFGRPFDLLLLDLDIRGGMGGVETLKRLRKKNPNVRAVVTTGYVDNAVLSNYQDHGFCGMLAKPFRVDQLVAVVSRLAKVKKKK